MTDDFTDYPKSITEQRADKNLTEGGMTWGVRTPRDALIETLRNIDSGRLNPTGLIVCYSFEQDGNTGCTGGISSGPSFLHCLGLISRHLVAMQGPSDD